MEDSSEGEQDSLEIPNAKRLKTRDRKIAPAPAQPEESFSLDPLLHSVGPTGHQFDEEGQSFEDSFDSLRAKYTELRAQMVWSNAERDAHGRHIRPLTLLEMGKTQREIWARREINAMDRLVVARLKMMARQPRSELMPQGKSRLFVEAIPLERDNYLAPSERTLDGLKSITRTPFEHSFASRLCGSEFRPVSVWLKDWETQTDWMKLCEEIHLHYFIRQGGENSCTSYEPSAIEYSQLLESDLVQVNNLLEQTFWSGINVKDSVLLSPQKCSVVARYKRLVVGVALLSAPEETYITYAAVRPGWEFAQIATCMLHLLIKHNPSKDIFLHVSANNPAMLLYNRFGFKAEEYIIGFYENYLPGSSRASKNAFRLRLRQ